MSALPVLEDANLFSECLFREMKQINPALDELELYEFRYALDNLAPVEGWASIPVAARSEIEALVQARKFFEDIRLKPTANGRVTLDPAIVRLAQILFAGLVTGDYDVGWVKAHFYFDVRGFFFLARTQYFTPEIRAHLGGEPYRRFEPKQAAFDNLVEISYREYRLANEDIDRAVANAVNKITAAQAGAAFLTIAGPTAAGKTEITARLREELAKAGKQSTSIEMDNFYKDRSYRDQRPMGLDVIHYGLFQQAIHDLHQGKKAVIPRYDFYNLVSSHDLESRLRPGAVAQEIEPADILFVEGNFPFYLPEMEGLVGIRIVYLADDPVRLKRKWKRDVDYRKKYDTVEFCNRYFRTQYLRAADVYQPLMAVCEMVVDTTAAELWVTPEIRQILDAV